MNNVRVEPKTRRKPVAGAWVLPALAILLGGRFGEQHVMEGHTALFVLAAGLVAGGLWQLLNRRDVVDRFTTFAVFVLVGAGFLVVAPSGYLLANSGPGYALAGVLAGVVLVERALRADRVRLKAVSS